MELRDLAPNYAVSAQFTPSDFATLAGMGVHTVICNRPDGEVPPELQAAPMQAAAEAAGIAFVFNPVIGGMGLAPASIEEQADAIAAADGKVVAYCASGMRSALMWALSQAGHVPTEEILETVAKAGFPMDHLKGQIDGLGQARG